jgi:hypothetical protein
MKFVDARRGGGTMQRALEQWLAMEGLCLPSLCSVS